MTRVAASGRIAVQRIASVGRVTISSTENRLLRSEEFDIASWTKQSGVTVTANQALAPDGTLTADLIDFTSAAAALGIFQQPPTSARFAYARVFTRTVWLRSVSGATTIGLTDVAIVGTYTKSLTTAWARFSFTESSAAAFGGLAIRNNAAGTTGQVYAWGAQSAAVNYVPPYVKTTSAAITGTLRMIG